MRLDSTEVRVRRPRIGRPGRNAFVSGKAKQNTIKATVVADGYGATLWCDGHRPGRMHDTTAARVEGIDALLNAYPQVTVLVDAGYQGLAKEHPDQVAAPSLKLRPAHHRHVSTHGKSSVNTSPHNASRSARHRGAEMVAATSTLHRPPRALPETIDAVAGLVSDRMIT